VLARFKTVFHFETIKVDLFIFSSYIDNVSRPSCVQGVAHAAEWHISCSYLETERITIYHYKNCEEPLSMNIISKIAATIAILAASLLMPIWSHPLFARGEMKAQMAKIQDQLAWIQWEHHELHRILDRAHDLSREFHREEIKRSSARREASLSMSRKILHDLEGHDRQMNKHIDVQEELIQSYIVLTGDEKGADLMTSLKEMRSSHDGISTSMTELYKKLSTLITGERKTLWENETEALNALSNTRKSLRDALAECGRHHTLIHEQLETQATWLRTYLELLEKQ